MYSLIISIITCILNLLFTPIIILYAHKKKLFDPVNERKLHHENIPRLGGIGIFWTSFVGIVAIAIIDWFNTGHAVDLSYLPVLGGMFLVHVLSLIDDFRGLSAKLRFAVQVIVSLALCWFGFRFHSIWIPSLGAIALPIWLSWTITIMWIVGVINAVNMIDGMDGLCGGISIIGACAYGILYLIRGEALPALYAFALVGALAGFLFYNFPPAKIFMGDSGSTYLGFMLAILPLLSRDTGNFDIQLFLGVTIVLIPIYDTFSAIWRRLKARVSIIQPDKWHLHHKLLHMGIGRRSILALVYASTMALGTLSILSTYLGKSLFVIITVCVWLVVMVLFFILHFFKERFVSREVVES